MFLEAMIENLYYLRINIVLRFTSIFNNMNMNRVVII